MIKIRNSILKKIKPSIDEAEKTHKFAELLLSTVKEIIGKDAIICGSIGKSTWLKGDHDIDMFIPFSVSTPRKKLEITGLLDGKKIIKKLKGSHEVKYAEHPYIKGKVNSYIIDIVPFYKIKKNNPIKSAVDRSPLHLDYVKENLDPGLRDDVRLLKQFCKGIGVYGSDTKTEGFSGYVCELLVMNYGRFENVLKATRKWKMPEVINLDISKAKKFINPLVIIDPIDSNRNAAANINATNCARFVKMADNFLKKPNMSYFFHEEKKISSKELNLVKRRGTKFAIIKMQRPDIVEDNLYPQLRKTLKRISSMMYHHGFRVMNSFEYVDKNAYLIFEFDIWNLPKTKKIIGPSIFTHKNAVNFVSKYKKQKSRIYIEDDKLIAECIRDFEDVDEYLSDILKRKNPLLFGIPKNIQKCFSKSKLISKNKLWDEIEKNLLTEFRKQYFEEII